MKYRSSLTPAQNMQLFKEDPISNADLMGGSRDETVDVLILQLYNILFNQLL